LVLLIDFLLILYVACCLGEQKGWQEQLGREESMVQQLNKVPTLFLQIKFSSLH